MQEKDPTSAKVYEDCENALAFTANQLELLVAKFVGPIWSGLPEKVRAMCRVAGMGHS
jgi:hypothetical protein